ncbi:PhnE/PtxC family ABC transporter permease [Clostridium sp.]|uniref:PhnE/PtxC family ABC transporter permease n=1 Tax=Clostridium sp. TaxID=1506 RepID=UPI003D6DA274
MSDVADLSIDTHKRYYIEHKKDGRIKTKAVGNSSGVINITIVTLILLTIYGFLTFDYKDLNLATAIIQTLKNLKVMFLKPSLTHFTLMQGINSVIITMSLAFLTTLLGASIAIILGLFAAKNLSNIHVSNLIKGFVAFIRAIPTVIWVLIFAISAGLGSVAAIVGLTFHSTAYLTKAYSESYEEIDEGVIEALKASGASWWQIVFQAIIPSTANYLVSWTFMRFEINFTNSVAMGAAAGAGGIGYELFMAGSFYFNVSEVGFISYLLVGSAIILEFISNRLKRSDI